jgi:hypothetical protein
MEKFFHVRNILHIPLAPGMSTARMDMCTSMLALLAPVAQADIPHLLKGMAAYCIHPKGAPVILRRHLIDSLLDMFVHAPLSVEAAYDVLAIFWSLWWQCSGEAVEFGANVAPGAVVKKLVHIVRSHARTHCHVARMAMAWLPWFCRLLPEGSLSTVLHSLTSLLQDLPLLAHDEGMGGHDTDIAALVQQCAHWAPVVRGPAFLVPATIALFPVRCCMYKISPPPPSPLMIAGFFHSVAVLCWNRRPRHFWCAHCGSA